MPLNPPSHTAPATRRLRVPNRLRGRLATPRCRAGASSLLRLSQPASNRLPRVFDLSAWLDLPAPAEVLPVTRGLASTGDLT